MVKKQSSEKHIDVNVPEIDFWDNPVDLDLKEKIIQIQNRVETEMKEKTQSFEPSVAKLIGGMIEIADVILKNTTGVGSNFKLAECDLSVMTEKNIRRFYTHVLSVLVYHFGQMIPDDYETIWRTIQTLIDDETTAEKWQEKLAACTDHESGIYSPVRSGRMLWDEVAGLFSVKKPETNTTARIYYQTAPGQDLIYVIESIGNQKWSGNF